MSDAENVILPNGQKVLRMLSNNYHYEIGYKNEDGKFKRDFRSLNLCHSWLDELRVGDYFCFVDTNKVNCSFPEYSGHMYVTGCYIFQMTQLEINHENSTIIWNRDLENIHFELFFNSEVEGCPEKNGWLLAIEKMNKMNFKKVKIIVDANLNELRELERELPEGWRYLYASSENSSTWFNVIFRRLNQAITILATNSPQNYNFIDIENFLMARVEHLIKKDGSHGRVGIA